MENDVTCVRMLDGSMSSRMILAAGSYSLFPKLTERMPTDAIVQTSSLASANGFHFDLYKWPGQKSPNEWTLLKCYGFYDHSFP